MLLAAAIAAVPLAASAQTDDGAQRFAPDQALVDQVQQKSDNHHNASAAQRLQKIVNGMTGQGDGYTAAQCRQTAARYGVSATWSPWCDEIERRENFVPNSQQNDPPPPPTTTTAPAVLEPPQDQQSQQQEDEIDQIAVQTQIDHQPGIRFTKSGNDITRLDVPSHPGTVTYGVSLTTQPAGEVILLFISNNFKAAWRNVEMDPANSHGGTVRPNVDHYDHRFHRARCNQSGTDYEREKIRIITHNQFNPSHLHLQLPIIDNYPLVCETIMTFTPSNWSNPQRMTIKTKHSSGWVMTPPCTGLVDGRFPERCNRDVIEHVAFSYDGGYPSVTKRLDLHLGG